MPNGWPTITLNIDSNLSLAQLEQRIATTEMQEQVQLIALVMSQLEELKVNIATFERDPAHVERKSKFVELPDSSALPNLISTEQAQGRSLVFRSSIYVQGVETPVAVFR